MVSSKRSSPSSWSSAHVSPTVPDSVASHKALAHLSMTELITNVARCHSVHFRSCKASKCFHLFNPCIHDTDANPVAR